MEMRAMSAFDDDRPPTYTGAMHAGGGTVLFTGPLAVILPGLLPFIALTVVFALPIVLPFVALALVAAIVGGPPWLVWRLVTRGRRRRLALALAEDEALAA
jgi:hypothetical protein